MTDELIPGKAVELQITGDGSHTLFVPGLNEHYHSVFGSITESRHIFLERGFKYAIKPGQTGRILEIGFGTGLNALLTCLESASAGYQVEYSAIELYPLKQDVYSRLNYPELIESPDVSATFRLLHDLPWNFKAPVSGNFSLLKLNVSIADYLPEKEFFDLIYFDAFGPDVQPEMWTPEVFMKMAKALKTGGVLVTYSTKGTVKRNLSGAGFSLEKLPGPPGKREILRATKPR